MSVREEMVLDERIRLMHTAPQTVEREIEIKRAERDLRELRAKRSLAVISKQRILFDAMLKTGRCTAIHDKSGQRVEKVHNEYKVDSPIQAFWNDWYSTEQLAEWATS